MPHTTNDLFYSHPDIVAYSEQIHNRSLAIVEVKRLPILKANKVINFNDPKMVKFLIQVIAEMFSNHTKKGMLTDSYTTILIELDIKRSLEAIKNKMLVEDNKPIALNYKILDCHSSGLTLRGGLTSFLYEAFNTNLSQLNETKRGLDEIYRHIRKTDEEYLTYLDDLAQKDEEAYKSYCMGIYKAKRICLYDTVIPLGNFADIDVQSGFTFNAQLFKVDFRYLMPYLIESIDVTDQLIVKVFDPVKAKRDHNDYEVHRPALFDKSRRASVRKDSLRNANIQQKIQQHLH